MTHLGCYYCPEHHRQEDRDYIQKLQPPVIRLLDPDVQQIADMHALAPNAVIACRTWAIDDGSDEEHPSKQVNRINADPVGTARDHAQQYRGQLDRWHKEAAERGLTLPPDDQIMFNGANEPNQGGEVDKIATYSVALCDFGTELHIRIAVVVVGVGWPDNRGPGTPVNWSPYIKAGLEAAIKRGNHWLETHEYFYKTGPQDGYRWLACRHLQCPLNVPILLGEIGIDNYVYNERWQAEPAETRGNRGWQGNVTPDQYAGMIEWHLRHSDTRVVAGLPYMLDFRDRHWESFNIRPAIGAFLAHKDACVPQVQYGATPTPPAPTGPTATPWTSAGSRIRSGPGKTYPVIANVVTGEPMAITGKNADGSWYRVAHPLFGPVGWVSETVVRLTEADGVPVVDAPALGDGPSELVTPAPVPASTSTGALDPRVLEAVLKVESGGSGFGADGRPTIRFEAHIFKSKLGNDARFDQFFRFNAEKPWTGQERRITINHPWKPIHTGSQADEYDAFAEAQMLGIEAAHQSISMGAAQIMGFNHARLGYPTAVAMFDAFKRSLPAQLIAFINYMLSDPALVVAIRSKDWAAITIGYNGSGNVAEASAKYKAAYQGLT